MQEDIEKLNSSAVNGITAYEDISIMSENRKKYYLETIKIRMNMLQNI